MGPAKRAFSVFLFNQDNDLLTAPLLEPLYKLYPIDIRGVFVLVAAEAFSIDKNF
jgi:hypothetical protein